MKQKKEKITQHLRMKPSHFSFFDRLISRSIDSSLTILSLMCQRYCELCNCKENSLLVRANYRLKCKIFSSYGLRHKIFNKNLPLLVHNRNDMYGWYLAVDLKSRHYFHISMSTGSISNKYIKTIELIVIKERCIDIRYQLSNT